MENKSTDIDLLRLFKVVWKNKKKVFKLAIIGAFVGVLVAFSIPKEYVSFVKFVPEMQAKPLGGSAGALANMMGVGGNSSIDGINEDIYPAIINSTPFILELKDIMVKYEGQNMLFSDYVLKHQEKPWWSYIIAAPSKAISWVTSLFKDKVDTVNINNSPRIQYGYRKLVTDRITIEKEKKTGITLIEVKFQDPAIAKMINDSLIVNLQKYMTEYRTAKTRSNLESNSKMLKEAQQKYYIAEETYANALDRNQNLRLKSPLVKLDRLLNEKNLSYQVYLQLATQVEADRVKLQEDKPIVTIIEPVSTPTTPSEPKTLIVIILFAFLGGFIITCKLIIKELV